MSERRKLELMCAALAALTLLVYFPAISCGFVNWDDPFYVTQNGTVQQGLTFHGGVWALKSTYASNWHPVTWLSHMLDCQLFGLKPAGHHLTNILLHTANCVLLFLILVEMTRAPWRSFSIAALFALHPMHVESVAWVAERKDVLSAFFGLLAIGAYARYARAPAPGGPDRRKMYYAAAFVMFVLGLMSKPMLVTLPFVFLLLDFWPLGRTPYAGVNDSQAVPASRPPLSKLILEKVPFFALSLASCLITVTAQRAGRAVVSLNMLPMGFRLENALVSYVKYLVKLAWPTHLAVFYPHASSIPISQLILALVVLVGISILALANVKKRPYLLFGWLWFIGTLVPVIGFMQVGSQDIADRYTYLPSVGLFIAAVWWLAELGAAWKIPRVAFEAGGALVLTACAVGASAQLRYWKSTWLLFDHARTVTQGNYVALENLGIEEAVAGKLDDAIADYRQALTYCPDYASCHLCLGNALFMQGKTDEAIASYRNAQIYRARFKEADIGLGTALARKGDFAGAQLQFREALRLDPSDSLAHFNYAEMLFEHKDLADAELHFENAARLNPANVNAWLKLGIVASQLGHFGMAVGAYQTVLRMNADQPLALNNLAWIRAASPDPEFRNGKEAVELARRACDLTANDQPTLLGTLAAAYAEAGDFTNAVATAAKARDLATTKKMPKVASRNEELMSLYQSGKPYHESAPSPPQAASQPGQTAPQ